MRQFITSSEDETKAFAKNLSKTLKGVIALTGDLGSGKTTFVQGFAQGLRLKEKIISPTFILIRQHKIPNSKKILFHIDLYRLEDFTQLGLEEIINDPNNIVLIEWGEKIKKFLPKNITRITFKTLTDNQRKIIVD